MSDLCYDEDMTATATFHVFIAACVFVLVMVVHSFVTDHAVPADLVTDCPGAQVLDAVTHTCGGV